MSLGTWAVITGAMAPSPDRPTGFFMQFFAASTGRHLPCPTARCSTRLGAGGYSAGTDPSFVAIAPPLLMSAGPIHQRPDRRPRKRPIGPRWAPRPRREREREPQLEIFVSLYTDVPRCDRPLSRLTPMFGFVPVEVFQGICGATGTASLHAPLYADGRTALWRAHA